MIDIKHISFAYHTESGPSRHILNDISLQIHSGESIAIMGSNGSGKTTLARCLNGLLIPDQGEILIDGLNTRDAKALLDIRKRVGMVFQNPDNQIVSATVEREIAFGLENLSMSHDEMHRVVQTMLDQFSLDSLRQKSPHYLSGGEKQRLALAAVMAMNPRYLVLDEPTSLLDPQSRRQILQNVRNLHSPAVTATNSNPITTILVTQFPEEALYTDRLLVLHQGKVVRDAPPRMIFQEFDFMDSIGLDVPVSFVIQQIIKEHS